jgi:2,4-dienoyl-CoA reductase-like NADH-dependent reductase (Old Yellow Enzyme family)
VTSLFDPLTLRSVTFRNRLGVSPMCMYSSDNGRATDWHLVHLGSRAVGGYALVMAEATAVEARGRISPEDAGLWEDSQIEPLARITRFVRAHGAVPGLQLAHAGRKASIARPWAPTPNQPLFPGSGGWGVVGPSEIPFDEGHPLPHALSLAEIGQVTQAFVDATQRAITAGYEVLEIHAAHGYLLHEFLSPLANKRDDDYGGSFDHRVRFLLEVARKVRGSWPDRLPLFVRLSCTDWVPEGWTIEDSVALSKRLKTEGVDLIDCSSGAIAPRIAVAAAPGFQVPFAEMIRKQADMPTAAVGMITEPEQAAAIVREERADLVFTAREALRDPYFPLHAARALGAPPAAVPRPSQYARS